MFCVLGACWERVGSGLRVVKLEFWGLLRICVTVGLA